MQGQLRRRVQPVRLPGYDRCQTSAAGNVGTTHDEENALKKLINGPGRVVREMLEGLADITPGIALPDDQNVVVRADLCGPAQRQVAVISGGGAGHESAHAGYLGSGMLHATVTGDVFTLLPVDAVMGAIQAVAGPAGVVLVVKNYTGDHLNFGLAAEVVRAAGIPTKIVVVADDVALRETVEPSRHRGIAGTVLIHKIAGAAAEAGAPVHEVAEAAQRHARCDNRRPKDRPWQPRGSGGERPWRHAAGWTWRS